VTSHVVYRPVDSEFVSKPRKVSETPDSAAEPPENSESVKCDEMKQGGKETLEEVVTNLASLFTMRNAKDVITFMSVFFVTCVTGCFHLVRYVGDFSIRFMREFSVFIQASTPIFISIIEVVGKCIGGFYLMLVMIFRGSRNEPPPHIYWEPNQRALPPPPQMRYNYRR
jgi:hypothetical protein